MSAEQETAASRPKSWGLVVIAWIFVCAPLAWGVLMTLRKAAQLFEPGR